MNKVLRLSQGERPELLQEKKSVVRASGFRSPSEIAAIQQKQFNRRDISIITRVIILKQLFASGS